MNKTNQVQPVFIGGTLAEHKLFISSMCRFDHISLPLSLFHYITWSIGHVAMYVIAERAFGPTGGAVWAALLIGWALILDARIGVLFGALEIAYAVLASVALSQTWVMSASTGATVGLAFATMTASLLVEVAAHIVVQRHPPGPPSRHVLVVPKLHFAAIGLYFAIVFGLFFLSLELAMRFLGYRPQEHQRVNEVATEWHRRAATDMSAKPHERDWHLRVAEAQAS